MIKHVNEQNNDNELSNQSSQMIRLSEGENNISNLDQTTFNGIVLPQTPKKDIQQMNQNQLKDLSLNMDLSKLISQNYQIGSQQEQNKNQYTDSSRLLDLTNLNEDSALDKLSSSEIQSRSQATNSDKQAIKENYLKRKLGDEIIVPYNLRDQTMQIIPEVSGTAENESTFQQEIENKEALDQSMTSIKSQNVNQLLNFFDNSMQSKKSVLINEQKSKAPVQSLQDISDIDVQAIYNRHASGSKVQKRQANSGEKQSARKLNRLSPDQKKKILEKRKREKQLKSKSVIVLDTTLQLRSRCDNLEKSQIEKLVQKQRSLLEEKIQLSQQLQDSQNQIIQLEKKIKALIIALENGGVRAFNDISAIIQDTSQIAPMSTFPFGFRAKNDITKSFILPNGLDGGHNMNLTQFDNLFTQLQTTQLDNDNNQQNNQSRTRDNLQKNIEDIEAQNQLYAKQLEVTQSAIMNLAANASLVFENQPNGMNPFDISDFAGVSQISRFGMNQQRFQNEINGSFMGDISAIQQPNAKFGQIQGKSYVKINNEQGNTPRQILDDSNFNCEVNDGDESKIGIGEQRTGLGESVSNSQINQKNKNNYVSAIQKNSSNQQNKQDDFLEQTPENFKNLPQALTSTIKQTIVQNRANYRDYQSINPFSLNQFEQAALRAQIFALNNNQNHENDGNFRKTADFANFKEVRAFQTNQNGNDSQTKILDEQKSEEIVEIQKEKNEIEVGINFNALIKVQDFNNIDSQIAQIQNNSNEFRGSIHQALPAVDKQLGQNQDSIGQIKVIQKQRRKTPFDEDGDDTVEEDGSYSAFKSLKQQNKKNIESNEQEFDKKSDDNNSVSKAGSKRLPVNLLPKQNEQVERSLKNIQIESVPVIMQPQRNSNERTDILGNMSYISVIPRDQDASYAVYLNNTQMATSGVPGTLINSPAFQQQDFLLNSFYANASFLNNVSVFEARGSASEQADLQTRGSKGRAQADQDFNIGKSPEAVNDKFDQNNRFQTTDAKNQQIQKTPQTPFFADIKAKNTGQSKITQNQFSEKFIRPYNPEQSPGNGTKSDVSHESKDKSESDPQIAQNLHEHHERFTLGDKGYAMTAEEAAVIQMQQQYLQEQQMRQRMLQFELLQQQEALRQMQLGQTSLLRAAQSGLGASALQTNSMITASFGGFGNSTGGLSQNQIQSIIMSQHENAKDKESIRNMFLQMVGRGTTTQRETFGEPMAARQSLGGGKNFFSNLLKQKKGQKQE